jgi:predicted RNA methylase
VAPPATVLPGHNTDKCPKVEAVWDGPLALDHIELDGPPADYVATVTAPSAIPATLTIREPVQTALDVGTGSGVQALWAARHCEHVIAVDVNPRALNLVPKSDGRKLPSHSSWR